MTINRKFRSTLILLGIWAICLTIYLLVAFQNPPQQYAPTPEAAKTWHFMMECSGGPYYYEGKGYLCDGYYPNDLLGLTIITGIITFILGITTGLMSLSRSRRGKWISAIAVFTFLILLGFYFLW